MSSFMKGIAVSCAFVVAIIGLSGCGTGKYKLVAGSESLTEADYFKAKNECIRMTGGESYSKKFALVPGVAPEDAPRTNVNTRYARCMESMGFVCLNCQRSFDAQPKRTQTQPGAAQAPEAQQPQQSTGDGAK